MEQKFRERMQRLAALESEIEVEKDRIAELHGLAVYCGTVLKKTPGIKAWDRDKLGRRLTTYWQHTACHYLLDTGEMRDGVPQGNECPNFKLPKRKRK